MKTPIPPEFWNALMRWISRAGLFLGGYIVGIFKDVIKEFIVNWSKRLIRSKRQEDVITKAVNESHAQVTIQQNFYTSASERNTRQSQPHPSQSPSLLLHATDVWIGAVPSERLSMNGPLAFTTDLELILARFKVSISDPSFESHRLVARLKYEEVVSASGFPITKSLATVNRGCWFPLLSGAVKLENGATLSLILGTAAASRLYAISDNAIDPDVGRASCSYTEINLSWHTKAHIELTDLDSPSKWLASYRISITPKVEVTPLMDLRQMN